jgi:4,5-DOPA dioxygenase extradiol
MPVLFIGHGSPMNAIADNNYTQMLSNLAQKIPRPKVILCISAHWMTEGTWITHQSSPKTIHDFFGFPPELSKIKYAASGSPKWAEKICDELASFNIQLDNELWGYDHGSWSVLRHMYPAANIPLLQLSLNISKPGSHHFILGEQLKVFRDQGVLIIGSGNIVHNLKLIQWQEQAAPLPWAVQFDEWIKKKLLDRDFKGLVSSPNESDAGKLSIPTWEHYYPLLYILGAANSEDRLNFHFEEIHNSAISMRTLSFGL